MYYFTKKIYYLILNNNIKFMENINLLFSSNDCPLVITSIHHPFKILYVNKSWELLCGYSQQEILGKSIFILKYKDINKNISINKKKNNQLFIHFFEIINYPQFNISIGKTKYYKNLQI